MVSLSTFYGHQISFYNQSEAKQFKYFAEVDAKDSIMEKWKSADFSPALVPSSSSSYPLSTPSNSDSRQKTDSEINPIASRKVQKADREKLRRDRLNEHFQELGHTLDPDRPKNDKATILNDSIQVLRDLAAEVSRLKGENSALSEESRELTQEKNELREEKASLKSEIETLASQSQQRAALRVMYPFGPMDPSSVIMAPDFPYPVPIPVPQDSIPFHPYFGVQNHSGAIPAPCSTFVPYGTNPPLEPNMRDSKKKSSKRIQKQLHKERTNHSNDVATELELKTPGSSSAQKDSSSSGDRNRKQSQRKGSSSTQSLSQVLLDSSSNSADDVPKS